MWNSYHYTYKSDISAIPVAAKSDNGRSCVVAVMSESLSASPSAAFGTQILTDSCIDYFKQIASYDFVSALKEAPTPHHINDWKKHLLASLLDNMTKALSSVHLQPAEARCSLSFIYISKRFQNAVIGNLGSGACCVRQQPGADMLLMPQNTSANAAYVGSPNAYQHLSLRFPNTDTPQTLGFMLMSGRLDGLLYRSDSITLLDAAKQYFSCSSNEQLQAAADSQFPAVAGRSPASDVSVVIIRRVHTHPQSGRTTDSQYSVPRRAPIHNPEPKPTEKQPEPVPAGRDIQTPLPDVPAAASAPAKKNQKGIKAMLTASFVVAGISILIAVLAIILYLTRSGDPQTPTTVTETTAAAETTATYPSGEVLTLENGVKYWGESENGVPNGKGVLLKDGNYFIGSFVNGKPQGNVSIVSVNGDYIRSISYDGTGGIDFPAVTEPTAQNESAPSAGEETKKPAEGNKTSGEDFSEGDLLKVISLSSDLKELPVLTSGSAGTVRFGDILTVTKDVPVTDSGTLLISVQTSDGTKGWIEADAVMRLQ